LSTLPIDTTSFFLERPLVAFKHSTYGRLMAQH
jgi:hypothetical protein